MHLHLVKALLQVGVDEFKHSFFDVRTKVEELIRKYGHLDYEDFKKEAQAEKVHFEQIFMLAGNCYQ